MAIATSADPASRELTRSILNDVRCNRPRIVSSKFVEKIINTGDMEPEWVTIPNPNQLGLLDDLVLGTVAALMRDYPDVVKKLRPDLYEDSPYTTAILEEITKVVAAHKFDVLRVHPADVLVADRAYLNAHAAPFVRFAICIGDRHTHITTIGIEDDATKLVATLTNLATKDVFFTAACLSQTVSIQWKQVTREELVAMSHTPSLYCRQSDGHIVTVKRVRNAGEPQSVGQAQLCCDEEPRAGMGGRWSIHLYPQADATPRDLIGLRRHAVRELEKRFTLFVNYTVHVH